MPDRETRWCGEQADLRRLAWLINLYPAVTHTFVRREIEAIEQAGHDVMRVAHRRPIGPLPSELDRGELARTRFLLDAGGRQMIWSVLAVAFRHPLRFLGSLWLTSRLGARSSRGLVAHLAYLVEAAVLLRWLRHEDIEHLHAHFGGNSAAVAMLCRTLGGPPFSFTVHGPQEFDDPARIHLRHKVKRSRFCIAISAFTAGGLRRCCDSADAVKIHVVRCGVDALFLDADIKSPPAEPRFVFIGRLDEQKNPAAAIQAIARLRDMGHPALLNMLGEGPLHAHLEVLIDKLNVVDRVKLIGACDSARVLAELAAARVLVLPSRAEGLPIVIMEAFAAGRPVIASDVGGVSELVEHGVNGWLVPAGSIDALVDTMLESIRCTPTQLHEMAMRGRHRVQAHHDSARNAGELLALIAGDKDRGQSD